MASLTYVCFVPAKGLIRDLSANSSNIAFEVPLASKRWWQSGLISHKDPSYFLEKGGISSLINFNLVTVSPFSGFYCYFSLTLK